MSLPEFKPSWELGEQSRLRASSPTTSSVQAVLVDPCATVLCALPSKQPTSSPEKPQTGTNEAEDWEEYDSLPLAELWSTLEKLTHEKSKPSAELPEVTS